MYGMLSGQPMRARRGFSLVELLISMTILAIVGTVATRMLVTQSRFAQLLYAKQSARAVGRASINLLQSELAMVQDTLAVDSLDTGGKAIRVRVPYQFGLICGSTTGLMTVSMLPVDSSILASAVYQGYAWRNINSAKSTPIGRYKYVATTTAPVASASTGTCTGTGGSQQNIQTFSMNGRSGAMYDLAPGDTNSSKSVREPVFFWQRIMYYFAASSSFPGYYGLYRKVTGGSTDELMAPFDSTVRFRFFKMGDDTSRTTITLADTASIVGVDVVLPGRSSRSLLTYTSPTIKLQAAIFFKNTRNF